MDTARQHQPSPACLLVRPLALTVENGVLGLEVRAHSLGVGHAPVYNAPPFRPPFPVVLSAQRRDGVG
eukprot:2985428-Rhodomonas_salina.1